MFVGCPYLTYGSPPSHLGRCQTEFFFDQETCSSEGTSCSLVAFSKGPRGHVRVADACADWLQELKFDCGLGHVLQKAAGKLWQEVCLDPDGSWWSGTLAAGLFNASNYYPLYV